MDFFSFGQFTVGLIGAWVVPLTSSIMYTFLRLCKSLLEMSNIVRALQNFAIPQLLCSVTRPCALSILRTPPSIVVYTIANVHDCLPSSVLISRPLGLHLHVLDRGEAKETSGNTVSRLHTNAVKSRVQTSLHGIFALSTLLLNY